MKKRSDKFANIPRPKPGLVVLCVALSILVHVISMISVDLLREKSKLDDLAANKKKVKIKIVERPKPKKILETKQEETEAPEVAKYRGHQNHKTEKETKVALDKRKTKAADAGLKGNNGKKRSSLASRTKPKPLKENFGIRSLIHDPQGRMVIGSKQQKPRNKYEELMPTSSELMGQINAGYQDYIDDKIAEGDKIDINTSDYRFIGYFTSMRKSIELVWNYPREAARRGLQGEVGVEFTLLKDGSVRRVKVVSSSGYEVLDDAIVEALKLASPFSPLPEGVSKDKLVITGSFRYVLTSYAGN